MIHSRHEETGKSEEQPARQKWPWWKKLVVGCLSAIILWGIADWGYSAVVGNNIRRWEDSVERNDRGILKGCEAYSIGNEKSQTTFLLVHGINDSPHVYRRVAPYLAEQGCHCRCMLVKGFGESVAAYGKADIADWLASVDKEIENLKKSGKKIVLVGHSLGGAISIRYVTTHQDSVDALVLAAPAVDVSSARSPLLPVQYWHAFLSSILVFTDTTQSPFGIDVLDPNEKESELRTPFTPIKVIDQTFELVRLNRQSAGKISLPVLMCLAAKDKVVDNEAAKDFFKRLPSPQKKLVVLENSAHALLFDYQWQDFAEHVAAFGKKIK